MHFDEIWQVKHTAISAAANGTREIVAAVSGKKIVVLSYYLSASATVAVIWKSATTALSGSIYVGNWIGAGPDSTGIIETASGAALNLTIAAEAGVGGHLSYVEV